MQFIKITDGSDSLAHFGIPGMRWGHRKSQYTSSELSDRQKAKASKAYKKEAVKLTTDLHKDQMDIYVKAHNKTADQWNNGKQKEFDKKHDPKSKNYEDQYMKSIEKDMDKNLNQVRLEYVKSHPSYLKGQEIVKKYDMLKYDDLAKDNAAFVDYLMKNI